MDSRYPKLVRGLVSYIVHSGTCTLPKALTNWSRECDFELHLCHHARRVFADWHTVELLDILPSHRTIQYVWTPDWWQALKGFHLLCVPKPPVFGNYSNFDIKHHARQNLNWRMATSKFVVCPLMSFLGPTCPGNSASVYGESHEMSVKKGKLASLPSLVQGHIEQSKVLELLHHSSYDMKLGLLAYSRSQEADWSPYRSSRYPHDFDIRWLKISSHLLSEVRNCQKMARS